MEVFALLVASKYGIAALGTVSVAICMLASSFGLLAYKSSQREVRVTK
jgi:hypothetical protein